MIKKLFFMLLLASSVLSASAQVERPKLVVGLVVDQMCWDYLYYYYNEYGNGGLKRLLNEGFSCENTHLNYTPTVTAVGHSTIFTGAFPSVSGIAGNNFAINDKEVYCCTDNGVKSVGSNNSAGQMSPHNMLVTTIGDELRIATNYQSKVIGVSLKDRASILPAGQSANAAYWWDTKAGHFVTSTYYMNELPQWVTDFNKANHTKPGFNIKTSNLGVTVTFKMAEAALKNEQLGKHDGTDMLTVSISSTDAIGHTYSTRGKENHDVYMQLDKDLTTFLNTLDSEVGKGNYLLFLTADHGAAHNYNQMKSHKIPAGAWDYDKTTTELNTYLKGKFGMSQNPVMFEDNYQFFFNDSLIAACGKKKQDLIDASLQWLRNDPQFVYAVDNEKVATATMPDIFKKRIINGYFPHRSGEISVVTRPQFFGAQDSPTYKGTQHGQPYPYDTHIPLVFMGWHVAHGQSNIHYDMTDIAPTVCAMLHIQMPDGCVGTAIPEIAK